MTTMSLKSCLEVVVFQSASVPGDVTLNISSAESRGRRAQSYRWHEV